MKQLNFRHFNTNSKKLFETVTFFQKEAKTAPKRPILFCLAYKGILPTFRQFRIISKEETVEDFRRLAKRFDHCRRCPKNPPDT